MPSAVGPAADSRDPGHFRARNAARSDGRSRAIAALVLAGLRDGMPAHEIAREAGMGLRRLRRYLTHHDHDDLNIALDQRRRRGW